jgi:hypothetical protein
MMTILKSSDFADPAVSDGFAAPAGDVPAGGALPPQPTVKPINTTQKPCLKFPRIAWSALW